MAVDGDPAAATRDQVLSVLSLDKGSCSRRLGASALALTKGLPRTCAGGAVRDQPRLRSGLCSLRPSAGPEKVLELLFSGPESLQEPLQDYKVTLTIQLTSSTDCHVTLLARNNYIDLLCLNSRRLGS